MDIQLFGSNDTISSSREGKLVIEFYDGDNRTFPIDDPKSNLSVSNVKDFITFLKTNQPVIGDKTGASIVGASSFKIVEKTDTKLDLT